MRKAWEKESKRRNMSRRKYLKPGWVAASTVSYSICCLHSVNVWTSLCTARQSALEVENTKRHRHISTYSHTTLCMISYEKSYSFFFVRFPMNVQQHVSISLHAYIHPSFIHYRYAIQGRGGGLEPIPADFGRMRGTPWTGRQTITGLTHRDRQPFTLTFTPTGNL